MPIGVQQFPILTPGQMNPYNQALSSGLDTYQNMMKAAYAPQQTQANINAKNAYASNVGRQMIATVLSNPMAVASMDDAQFKSLLGQVTNPAGGLSGTAAGSNSGGQQTSTGIGGMWDKLMQNVGLKDAPSPAQGQQASPSSGSSSNAYEYNPDGTNVKATPEQVNNIANNGNNAYQNDSANVPQGTSSPAPVNTNGGADNSNQASNIKDAFIAKNFPGTPQGVAAAGRIKAAEVAASTGGTSYQTYRDNVYTSSNSAQNALNDLKDFHSNYNKAWAKGPLTDLPIARQLAKLDPNYQTAVNDANNLVVNLAPVLLAGGKQTDAGRALIKNAKISTDLVPDAENHVFQKQSLILDRIGENDPFVAELEKRGIKDVNQQRSAWLDYNRKYPLVNKEGDLINQNSNKYSDYISKNYGGAQSNQGGQQGSVSGFDPTKMLDSKFKSKDEFKAAFDTLGDEAKAKVIAEMKRRNWH